MRGDTSHKWNGKSAILVDNGRKYNSCTPSFEYAKEVITIAVFDGTTASMNSDATRQSQFSDFVFGGDSDDQ